MLRLRWVWICGCLGLACSTGEPAPGSSANTTSGPGPTTFATFSTTVPPQTDGSGTDETGGSSDSSGSETGDTDTDTFADGSSSTTSSGLCPSSHLCLDEAPEGWSGPVAVRQSAYDPERPDAPPPSCGETYPTPARAGFEDLTADAASCSCECADPNGIACANSTTLRFWGGDTTCEAAVPQTLTVFTSSCNTLPAEFASNGNYTAAPLPTVGGACAPSSDSSVEPPSWSWQTQACRGGTIIEDAGCAGGRECAPLPDDPDAALCIWQEGAHACPEAFDSSRTLYGDVQDDRGCESCSCSAPTGLCDSAVISLWNGSTCLVPSAGTVAVNGECDPASVSTAANAASLSGGSPNAFCVPSEPTPSGEAVGTDPVTVCCLAMSEAG